MRFSDVWQVERRLTRTLPLLQARLALPCKKLSVSGIDSGQLLFSQILNFSSLEIELSRILPSVNKGGALNQEVPTLDACIHPSTPLAAIQGAPPLYLP